MRNQKDNIKYIFLDVWETLLLSNKNEKNINTDRAKIIFDITNFGNIAFWKNKIEEEILQFKEQELIGFSITPQNRIKKILNMNGLDTTKSEKILCEYDKLIIQKYRPYLNKKLLNNLIEKNREIILISNTGLTSKNAVMNILNQFGIINNFKDMFFSEDYKDCKQNISFYKIPLQKYKLKINEVVMYGDSKIMDFNPCYKLGINCIIKQWG